MATSRNNGLSLLLKSTHCILHALTFIVVAVAVCSNSDKNKTIFTERVAVWLALEFLYVLASSNILVYTLSMSGTRLVPIVYTRVKTRIAKAKDINLFYYSTMSMFVLYGTMIGCHVPLHNIDQTWEHEIILAIFVSGVNAILYFIAAFIDNEKGYDKEEAISALEPSASMVAQAQSVPFVAATIPVEIDPIIAVVHLPADAAVQHARASK